MVPGEVLGAYRGNMKELRMLTLHCATRQARNFRMFLVSSKEHVEQFMTGDSLDHFRSVEL